jgi:Tol biopolymer transport system component
VDGQERIAWSNDGSAIALVTAFGIESTTEQGRLWVVPLDGGEPRVLLQGRGALRGLPSWSHDDTTIAITAAVPIPEPSADPDGSDAPAGKTWHILAVPVDGKQPVRDLGRGNEPAFSPVDDRLAYVADAASGKFGDHSGIVVVDLATGAEHLVPKAAIPEGTPLASGIYGGGHGVWFPHSPSWSADGRGLLYVGSDGNWGTSILLAASAHAGIDPVALSDPWDQEWYGDRPYAVRPR